MAFMQYTLESRLSTALSLFFLCLLAACGESSKDAAPRTVAAHDDTRTAAARKDGSKQVTYTQEAASLDAAIDGAVLLIEKQPDNTLLALETVTVYTDRARLTGNYDDYARAQALLDVA